MTTRPPSSLPDRLDALEHWLDRAFRLPGTSYRFGLDGLLGLVPGLGDTATAALSGYFMLEAWRMGARKRTILAMGKNVGVDWLVGTIPVIGDLFDFAHKANTKNLRLLKAERDYLAGDADIEMVDITPPESRERAFRSES